MKTTFITLIAIFCSIPLISHEKEGWYWEPEIPLEGNSNGFVYRSDTLFTVVEDGVDTYMISSVDHGETWEEYIYYDWAAEGGSASGQTNPGEPILLNDSSIYVGNDYEFSFYELKRGEREFRHIRIDNTVRPGAFDQYDLEFGFATAALSNHYVTRDGWRTVDSIPKGDTFTAIFQVEILNDSIVIASVFDRNVRKSFFGHLNINTNTWKIFGDIKEIDQGLRLYDRVTDNLIYGTCITVKSGIGNQKYDIIYRSRDGGLTWENLLWDGTDPGFGLRRIAFHDELNGFAVGIGGRIYMTNDGGETWDYTDLVEEELAHPMEELYGPNGTIPAWSDTVPIFSGIRGVNYTYRGDFFNFDYEEITPAKLDLPADGSFLSSNKTLSWVGGESDPEYYHLQVTTSQRDYDRWLTLSVNERLQEKSFELSTLSPDSTYYWRVLTVKGSQIRESEVRSFTVWDEITLEPTEILCPSREPDVDTLRINWLPVVGADFYEVSLTSGLFGAPQDELGLFVANDTIYKISDSARGSDYSINVRAAAIDGADTIFSKWSEACWVYVALERPEIISPECGATGITRNDIIKWTHQEPMVSTIRFIRTSDSSEVYTGYQTGGGRLHISTIVDQGFLEPSVEYSFTVFNTYLGGPYSHTSNPCSFTTAPWLSVEESDSDIKILSIDGALSVEGISSIETLVLIDVTGRTVLQSRTNTINTSSLSAGNYFLVINGTEYKKVVVQ